MVGGQLWRRNADRLTGNQIAGCKEPRKSSDDSRSSQNRHQTKAPSVG